MEKRRLKAMMDATPKYKYLYEIVSNVVRSFKMGPTRTPYQLDELPFVVSDSERDVFIPDSKWIKKFFLSAKRTRSINYVC